MATNQPQAGNSSSGVGQFLSAVVWICGIFLVGAIGLRGCEDHKEKRAERKKERIERKNAYRQSQNNKNTYRLDGKKSSFKIAVNGSLLTVSEQEAFEIALDSDFPSSHHSLEVPRGVTIHWLERNTDVLGKNLYGRIDTLDQYKDPTPGDPFLGNTIGNIKLDLLALDKGKNRKVSATLTKD